MRTDSKERNRIDNNTFPRMKAKNFRKRSIEADEEDDDHERRCYSSPIFQLFLSLTLFASFLPIDGDITCSIRSALALEEVKFLQRQREKKSGIPALLTPAPAAAAGGGAADGSSSALVRAVNDKAEGDAEKDELVLQDTFAQETAVLEEDPNMYVSYSVVLFLFYLTQLQSQSLKMSYTL